MTWNQLVIRASHLNVIIQQRIDKVNNDMMSDKREI